MSFSALDLVSLAVQKARPEDIDKLQNLCGEIQDKIRALQDLLKTEDELFGSFLGDGKTLVQRYGKWEACKDSKDRHYLDFWEMKWTNV